MRLGLIIILASIWTQIAWAFPEHIAPIDLSDLSRYYVDATGQKTIEDIRRLEPGAWQAFDAVGGNFGFRDETFWFQIALPACTQAHQKRVLEVAYPLLDQIEFWSFSNATQGTYIKTGDALKASERPYEHLNFGFPVSCNSQTSLYLKVSTEGIMQVPLKLWPELGFVSHSYKQELPQIFYMGAMLMMVFYNAFVMISARRLNYLYFILHTTSIVAFQAGISGIGFRYVWPHSPIINDYIIDKSILLMVLFALAFGVSHLEMKDKFPRTYQLVIRMCLAISAYFFISFALPYHIAMRLSIAWVFIGIALGLYMIGIGYTEGHYKKFWHATWVLFLAGAIGLIISRTGLTPRYSFMEHSMQLGTVLVSALISYAMADQLNLLRLNLAESNEKLERTLALIETIVLEKTENIRTIMNTLQQGIITVKTTELLIEPEYSRATESILGRKALEGSHFEKAFLERLDLGADIRGRAVSALQISLHEDPLSFELNAPQLPVEAQIKNGQGLRDLVIDWVPILKDDVIDRYLIAFRDVTELKVLRLNQKKQSEMLSKLQQIVDSDVRLLRKFLQDSEYIIHNNLQLPLTSSPDDDQLKRLLIYIHTLKGESRSLGLEELADRCHQLEDTYMAMRQGTIRWAPINITESLDRVRVSLESYRQIYQENIEHLITENDVLIDQSTLSRWKDKLNVMMLQDKKEQEALRPILSEIYNILYLSFDNYKLKLQLKIRRIAYDLGQVEPELRVHGDMLYLQPKIVDLLDRCFIHIFQNSLVHGIEDQAQRREQGKSPVGNITIAIAQKPFFVHLLIEDDGVGVEIAKVRQKAIAMGYILPDQKLDEETIKNFILRSGFSSADVVTAYAGRGVGLDAIRHFVSEFGGQFNILFAQEKFGFLPMQLIIELPAHLFPDVPWQKLGDEAA